jgi:uncharacterized protein (DUF427 family)
LVRGDSGIPIYYFPQEHVTLGHPHPSGRVVTVETKGNATFWNAGVGDCLAENTAWTFDDAEGDAAVTKGYVAFDWSQIDRWFEEDEEAFVHARDPYHRVDVVNFRRSVGVVVGGKVLAKTTRSRVLFEAELPVRYYIHPEDVMIEVMEPSGAVTQCPYKGSAEYFRCESAATVLEDIVWTYPGSDR